MAQLKMRQVKLLLKPEEKTSTVTLRQIALALGLDPEGKRDEVINLITTKLSEFNPNDETPVDLEKLPPPKAEWKEEVKPWYERAWRWLWTSWD